jgi:hypothetical protein
LDDGKFHVREKSVAVHKTVDWISIIDEFENLEMELNLFCQAGVLCRFQPSLAN